jgi:hypothetical protein
MIWPPTLFYSSRDFASDWRRVQPVKGEWAFEKCDRDVKAAHDHHVEMLLVLNSTTPWAAPKELQSDPAKARRAIPADSDWANYVHAVATRYKGTVHEYELWNEPDMDAFFGGDIDDLIHLDRVAYETLKTVDPTITVVSSSFAGIESHFGRPSFEQYLEKGGAKYADVIGFHFYAGSAAGKAARPPETMLNRLRRAKELMDKYHVQKPMWITETGWRILNKERNTDLSAGMGLPLNPDQANAFVARSYILEWAAGFQRVYWYAYDEVTFGMTEFDLITPKPMVRAFGVVQRWLVGAVMSTCASDSNSTWVCDLKHPNGRSFHIVWNVNGTTDFHVPTAWKATAVEDLHGARTPLASTKATVNESPQLFDTE